MSAQKIYDLIDDLIHDLNNGPVPQIQSLPSNQNQNQNQSQGNKGGKKNKKRKKVKKQKQPQKDKPTQKTSKRATKLTKSQLPLPILRNGIKSTLLEDMQSTYDPFQVECLWDKWWEDRGYYKPKMDTNNSNNFVMVIPPPNVTGSLHLGHALMATIEDTITRYWRMKGKNCLWLPGTDHAGIATQTVVERRLAKEGKTRHDLGREKFLSEIWKWKEQKGGKICNQLRKMGCSVDWSREVFTMDKKLSVAVTEAFVRLYDLGYIYRDNRLCNWSCSLQSAISDVEIDKIEIDKKKYLEVPGYNKRIAFGILHKFGYKVIDSPTNEIVIVATTRLETMLGDTAVAIHPKDERYKHLHGKFVQHPFMDRKLPIICDDILVDMTFGTGCVKITPAHDHNDFECGKRHNLEFINILSEDGTINKNGGIFAGKKRYDVRIELIKELDEMKLFYGEENNAMILDQCSRSKDIIEPLIKPQWYMNCDELAQRSLDCVFKYNTLKILPKKEGEQQWNYFLSNIRKWCISRQLWWGHRIPAYKIVFENNIIPTNWDINDWKCNWIVGRTLQEATNKCNKILWDKYGNNAKDIKYKLEQDEDVLDTWFSSGLFPFSTMGWPNETDDLKSFFPGDLLETGGDIIFFWVARMVMMSLALTDKLPFHTVYLHPMVRDEKGAKMSKSSGNVIDPLHIINGVELKTLIEELHGGNIRNDKIAKFEKQKKQKFPNGIASCGADALRFGLSTLLVQRSINLNINTVIGYRLFCNKIWQATKLSLSYFDNNFDDEKTHIDNNPKASVIDKWILSKLNKCIVECENFNQNYDFGGSTMAIYQFFYHEFCPIYLEAIKPVMWSDGNKNEKRIVRNILYIVLRESFKMMHIFMPYLTEELFQRIKKARYGNKYNVGDEAIIISSYPDRSIKQWENIEIENAMNIVDDLSGAIRSIKQSQFGLSTRTKYNNNNISMMKDSICTLSMSESVQLFNEKKQNKNEYFVSTYDVYESVEKKLEIKEDETNLSKMSLFSIKEISDTIKIYSDIKITYKNICTNKQIEAFQYHMDINHRKMINKVHMECSIVQQRHSSFVLVRCCVILNCFFFLFCSVYIFLIFFLLQCFVIFIFLAFEN